ncbi:acyltransferase family protein [Variovorax sp. RHLX14]|uniref:acyltransferase family protein n=1 Tax=Variovorax sp. RHLX14 TaxID=1259731 RepID=UPI003F47CE82
MTPNQTPNAVDYSTPTNSRGLSADRTYHTMSFLRAFAALWVVVTHCMIWGGAYWRWLPNPKLAVDLFMMLSGFVMMASTGYAKDAATPRDFSWRRFWWRRFFRIAPAYYLSLFCAVTFSNYYLNGYQEFRVLDPERWGTDTSYAPMLIHYTAENVLLHLSFLFGLHPAYSWATFLPDWSLSLEMQFYAVFPLLVLAMRRFGMILVALVLAALAWRFIPGLRPLWQEPALLLFKLQTFMAGMLAFTAVAARGRYALALFAAGCALIALDPSSVWRSYVLYAVLFIGARLEHAGRLPSALTSLLQGRLVRFTAETSYSVYLFHGFFIAGFGLILTHGWLIDLSPFARVCAMLVFVVPGVYLFAHLVMLWVEKPGIALGNRLTRRKPVAELATDR